MVKGVIFFWRKSLDLLNRISAGRILARGITGFLLTLLFLPYGYSFLSEGKSFQDPFYRAPFVQAVSQTAETLAGDHEIFWAGGMYSLHPKRFMFHPLDGVGYICHVYSHSVQLYTKGKMVLVIAENNTPIYFPTPERNFYFVAGLGQIAKDGDVCIINPDSGGYNTDYMPPELSPLWVERCRILEFAPPTTEAEGTLRFTGAGGAVSLTMKPSQGGLLVEGGGIPPGPYELYVRTQNVSVPFLAKTFLVTGEHFSTVIHPPPHTEITGCFLLTFDQIQALRNLKL